MSAFGVRLSAKLLCPSCGARLNFAKCVEGPHLPKDGSVNVCGECAAVSMFVLAGTTLTLRPASDADMKALDADERADLRTAIQRVRGWLSERN